MVYYLYIIKKGVIYLQKKINFLPFFSGFINIFLILFILYFVFNNFQTPIDSNTTNEVGDYTYGYVLPVKMFLSFFYMSSLIFTLVASVGIILISIAIFIFSLQARLTLTGNLDYKKYKTFKVFIIISDILSIINIYFIFKFHNTFLLPFSNNIYTIITYTIIALLFIFIVYSIYLIFIYRYLNNTKKDN